MKNPFSFQNIFLQKFSKCFLYIKGQSYQHELGILEDVVNVSSLSTWYWAKEKAHVVERLLYTRKLIK